MHNFYIHRRTSMRGCQIYLIFLVLSAASCIDVFQYEEIDPCDPNYQYKSLYCPVMFLYGVHSHNISENFTGSMAMFSINPHNGSLTNPQKWFGDQPEGLYSLATNHNGFLFTTSNKGGYSAFYSFSINPEDGSLTPKNVLEGSGLGSHCVTAAKDTPCVVFSELNNTPSWDNLRSFFLNDSGELEDRGGAGANYASLQATSATLWKTSGQLLLYIADFNSIRYFSFDADCALTFKSFIPTASSRAIAIEPTGQFLFAAHDKTSPNLSVYRIIEGQLEKLENASYESGDSAPNSLTVDPSGKFLYVANGNNTLAGFKIYEDGTLVEIFGSPWLTEGTDNKTFSVTIAPTGHFVYVSNTDSIAGFQYDPDSGELTLIGVWPTDGEGLRQILIVKTQ